MWAVVEGKIQAFPVGLRHPPKQRRIKHPENHRWSNHSHGTKIVKKCGELSFATEVFIIYFFFQKKDLSLQILITPDYEKVNIGSPRRK